MTIKEIQTKIVELTHKNTSISRIQAGAYTEVYNQYNLHHVEKNFGEESLVSEIAQRLYDNQYKLYTITHDTKLMAKCNVYKFMINPQYDIEKTKELIKQIKHQTPKWTEEDIYKQLYNSKLSRTLDYYTFHKAYKELYE